MLQAFAPLLARRRPLVFLWNSRKCLSARLTRDRTERNIWFIALPLGVKSRFQMSIAKMSLPIWLETLRTRLYMSTKV